MSIIYTDKTIPKINIIGNILFKINTIEGYCYIKYYDKFGNFIKVNTFSVWKIVTALKEYGKVYGRMKKYYENSSRYIK